jgi:hypothetical protein
MHHWRKDSAAAQRFAERRERENSAPRLAFKVPRLKSLCLEVEERSETNGVAQPKHLRRIVVNHAPALFLVPCSDPNCRDGGHDVTDPVMQSLMRGEEHFEGEDRCFGQLGPSPCQRTLHYTGLAEYGVSSS